MAKKQYKACKKCHLLSEVEKCPKCGGETSREWQGYAYIVDYKVSAIAKALGVDENGRYALRVR